MTGSSDWFSRTVVASAVAAGAIVVEHLAASEVDRGVRFSPEESKRLSNFLGVSTIYLLFLTVAEEGDSRGVQAAKLGAITLSAGVAALACSGMRGLIGRFRAGERANGRLAGGARQAREGDGLDAWRRSFGA